MQKFMQFLQMLAHMNVGCKQRKYNNLRVFNAFKHYRTINTLEVSSPQSSTDVVKLQK